ncbi:hypothetical protein BBO_08009 [Beauveria brongniartii RCEF 3172]|uniref:Uncharacterized protein n=1 Tax=Beauveria brongniartii RCEF 3172 TaxID=1081107 RepID=A0A166YBL7_9HYPO|nr:hypothetical protein BBO_08009 [Beauveria brongniartii RCEF 3172]
MASPIAPRPPPLPCPTVSAVNHRPEPTPPSVACPPGPPNALLLELIIANGYPFKDHWSYFVRSRHRPDVGVVIHATGDVANGFRLEVKRSLDLGEPDNRPSRRIPLQWLTAPPHLDEQAMLNHGQLKFDTVPVGALEESLFKVEAPGKTLNTVGVEGPVGKRIVQRNCQSWIMESAEQLVIDGMLSPEIAAYLRAIEQ